MAFDPKEVKAGDPISAVAWNEMGRAVKAGQRISGGAGVYARNSGNGLEIAVSQPDEMDFKITGGPDENGGYEWDRVVHSSAGDNYWVDSGISGGTDSGDPVYPRQYGLPKPVGRVLILIPPLTRHGNFLHAGQAWLSFGLGLRLPAGDTVYHAVRADGDSQWVFDAIGPDLSTTSDARVYVCCHSSTSSSTSGHPCPTNECKNCDPRLTNCTWHATIKGANGIGNGPGAGTVPCGCFNAFYTFHHASGCSWVAEGGDRTAQPDPATFCGGDTPTNCATIMVTFSGSSWTAQAVDCVGNSITFAQDPDQPTFNCHDTTGALICASTSSGCDSCLSGAHVGITWEF